MNRKSQVSGELSETSLMEATNSDDVFARSNLTNNQLLIWVEQRLNPETPLYNMSETFTIFGKIEPEYFQEAFQATVDQTDSLRIVIEEIDSSPQQHILPRMPYQVDFLDFSEESNPQEKYQLWFSHRCVQLFNPKECLFDSALIKVAPDQFIWFLNQHHIITDGWSTSLIYQRVSQNYSQLIEGHLSQVQVRSSFQDYLDFERAYRKSSQFKNDKSFWHQKLAEPIEPTRFYGKSLPQKTMRVQRVVYDLGYEQTQKLKKVAMSQDIRSLTLNLSLFNIFSALLFTYLHRISGNQRLSIGTPFHNRNSNDLKDTIGLLMEVCALQVEIEKDETFVSLIGKVRNEMLQVLRHSRLGTGNSIHHQVYNVTLNYLPANFPDFCNFPTHTDFTSSGFGMALNDLYLLIVPSENLDNFTFYFDFNIDIFDETLRTLAIQHFLNIVDCFLEDHTQPISQIDFLTEEERHHILIDLNQTEMINPVDQTIVQQFKAQVDRVPDKIALRVTSQVPECDDEEMELTYRELNERANQLARHLKLLGVEPETFVGIYMDRSIDMVVGLLGILKAGGAYVPLDPAFPEDRLAYMLADSQARVLLTQESLREHKFNHADLKQICLDSDWPVIAGQDVGNIFSEAEASNLAYVIYTSGSTGKPKGVEITNGSVINFLTSMRQEPGLGEDDVLLSVTTLSFDIAVLEIFLPLTTGACLFLVDRETAMNGQGLNKKLTSSRATVMQATPITWRMLIDSGWQGDHHLKILCGGEALPRALANQLLERCGSLWNMYGPTETTVWSTINRVERGGEAPSIGRPIANTQIYILDPYMRPVPIGVTGELYIGGEGLARGYHNQPQLTASKFLPNPFSGRDSARLYRTGDLACFMPDGKIEFFGRIDHQVKVRGFRIELDEIEGVLEQHPEIQQAVVVAQEDDTGNKRLVAYLLTVNGLCPSVSELRTYLKRILPDYMVPSAFMFLEAFPLTPNKKVNRRALPIPDTERPDLEVTYVAPKTELQRIIASIWQDVLSLERIGIDDDFFDLGGNSLLAMQVISRINKTLVIDLSVRDLFENPTLEGLAQRNTEAQEDQEDKEPGTKKKRREIIL